jgi:hypothetical protein
MRCPERALNGAIDGLPIRNRLICHYLHYAIGAGGRQLPFGTFDGSNPCWPPQIFSQENRGDEVGISADILNLTDVRWSPYHGRDSP